MQARRSRVAHSVYKIRPASCRLLAAPLLTAICAAHAGLTQPAQAIEVTSHASEPSIEAKILIRPQPFTSLNTSAPPLPVIRLADNSSSTESMQKQTPDGQVTDQDIARPSMAQALEPDATLDEAVDADPVDGLDTAPPPPPEGAPDGVGELEELNPKQDPDSEVDHEQQDPERIRGGVSAAIVVPHIVNMGFETMFHGRYGVSINYGNISRNIGGVDLGIKHADLRFRYHPMGTAFFAGLALGQQTLSGEKKKDISVTVNNVKSTVPTTFKSNAKANYVAPHIGWFAIWEPGFMIGLDVGWLVPVNPTSSSRIEFTTANKDVETALRANTEFGKAEKDVVDATDTYAKKSSPFLTMMRVGWMF